MVAALCTLWRQLSVNPAPSCLFRPPFLPRIRPCTAVFIPLLLAPLLHLLWAYPFTKNAADAAFLMGQAHAAPLG